MKMMKKTTEVDPKYVALLNKAFEKYSKLEVVNSTFEHFREDFKKKTTKRRALVKKGGVSEKDQIGNS